MKKTRVLFLLHDARVRGGANSSMFDVLDNLQNTEIFVAIPYYDASMIQFVHDKGFECFVLSYPSWIYRVNNPFYKNVIRVPQQFIKQFKIMYTLPKLKKIIKDNAIDVIYTNTFCIYIGCIAKKLWGIKHIWHIREYGLEDHGFGIIFGYNIFVKLMNKYSDQIIFISRSLETKYRDKIINKSKIHVIYDDVSSRFINNKRNTDENINVLMAGLIQEGKGQLEVIKAFEIASKEVNNLRLYIAGDTGNRYFHTLKRFIDDHSLNDKISFLGFVEDMNALRANMDIGVVASRSEAFGRVTIEGMLSKMVMIGADASGTSELINDGVTGILYKPGDYSELANKIVGTSVDNELRKKISENAFKYACDTFTTGKCAQAINELFEV